MFGFFTIIFLLSISTIILGLIRPSVFSRLLKSHATRKKIVFIFGSTILVSFIGMGATAPPVEPEQETTQEGNVESVIDSQALADSSIDAEEENLGQEDEVTTEASFASDEPQTDVLKDSGSSNKDTQVFGQSPQNEESSSTAEVEDESVSAPVEVETPAPIQEAEETENSEEPADSAQEDTASCYCSSNTYNCSYNDFSSTTEAQALYECCLEQVGYDVHDLDRNNDGQACESLSE
jgi:hypothetical protein